MNTELTFETFQDYASFLSTINIRDYEGYLFDVYITNVDRTLFNSIAMESYKICGTTIHCNLHLNFTGNLPPVQGELTIGPIFKNWTKLLSVNIEDFFTDESSPLLFDGTFYNCVNLQEITLPNSVYNVMYNTFENCYQLKVVKNATDDVFRCYEAFTNCKELREIWFREDIEPDYSYRWRGLDLIEVLGFDSYDMSLNSFVKLINCPYFVDSENIISYMKDPLYKGSENHYYVKLSKPPLSIEIENGQYVVKQAASWLPEGTDLESIIDEVLIFADDPRNRKFITTNVIKFEQLQGLSFKEFCEQEHHTHRGPYYFWSDRDQGEHFFYDMSGIKIYSTEDFYKEKNREISVSFDLSECLCKNIVINHDLTKTPRLNPNITYDSVEIESNYEVDFSIDKPSVKKLSLPGYTSLKYNTLDYIRDLEEIHISIWEPDYLPDILKTVKKASFHDCNFTWSVSSPNTLEFFFNNLEDATELFYWCIFPDSVNIYAPKAVVTENLFVQPRNISKLAIETVAAVDLTPLKESLQTLFITSGTEDASGMCESFFELQFAEINMPNLKIADRMFYNCMSLTTLNGFNSAATVTSAEYAFRATKINLDMSCFDTIKNLNHAFSYCQFSSVKNFDTDTLYEDKINSGDYNWKDAFSNSTISSYKSLVKIPAVTNDSEVQFLFIVPDGDLSVPCLASIQDIMKYDFPDRDGFKDFVNSHKLHSNRLPDISNVTVYGEVYSVLVYKDVHVNGDYVDYNFNQHMAFLQNIIKTGIRPGEEDYIPTDELVIIGKDPGKISTNIISITEEEIASIFASQ